MFFIFKVRLKIKHTFFALTINVMTLIKSISGIRGTIGGREDESLTPIDVVKYTTAFADVIVTGENKRVVVGRDARLSGHM
jgi:phosphomannomutase